MQPITNEELDKLSNAELVARMDEFINDAFIERNSHLPPGFTKSINLVTQVMHTSLAMRKSEDVQRRIAYICFSYLIQFDLGQVGLGISNLVLYRGFDELKWQSPLFRLKHAALDQYQIVASRIAFEIFIDLLHVLETGERIETKKSKLKAFKKWLFEPKNPFNYFAHVLLVAYQFDREQRTPEVHGTSKFPRKMLCLQPPSSDEQNNPLHLTNALLNSWHPLLEILNGNRPSSMQVTLDDHAWFDAFMSNDENQIEQELERMFEDIG
jgi:hypothetical protein